MEERVKFKIPHKEFFSWHTDLHVSHMNYGNHLGNDKVLTLCHEARVRWLKYLGYTELDIEGNGLIQTDSMIMYRAEGNLGDQVEIKISLGGCNSKVFHLYYSIHRMSDDTEIARVKTGMMHFNYQRKSICEGHKKFLEILGKYNS